MAGETLVYDVELLTLRPEGASVVGKVFAIPPGTVPAEPNGTPIAEAEICCGAAGSYNLTQPEMADRLGQRKVQNILDARVQAVFSGNVGCLLQIGRYLRRRDPGMWVTHLIDALWASYSGELPKLPKPEKGARERA